MEYFGIRNHSIIDTIIDDFYILGNEFSFEKEFFGLRKLECENSPQKINLNTIEFFLVDIELSFIFEVDERVGVFFLFFNNYLSLGSSSEEIIELIFEGIFFLWLCFYTILGSYLFQESIRLIKEFLFFIGHSYFDECELRLPNHPESIFDSCTNFSEIFCSFGLYEYIF